MTHTFSFMLKNLMTHTCFYYMLTFHLIHVSKGSCGIGTSRQTIRRHLLPQTGWCTRAQLLPVPHATLAFSLSGKSIIFSISHYLLSIRSTTISLQINEIIIVWQKSAKRLWLLFQFAPQFCEIAAHRHGDTYSRRSNLLRNWPATLVNKVGRQTVLVPVGWRPSRITTRKDQGVRRKDTSFEVRPLLVLA